MLWVSLATATHGGGEVGAELELLEPHRTGVGAEEEDEGHERDVRHKVACLTHQLALVLQTFRA